MSRIELPAKNKTPQPGFFAPSFAQVDEHLPVSLDGVVTEREYNRFAVALNKKIIEAYGPVKKANKKWGVVTMLGAPLWILSCGFLFLPYVIMTDMAIKEKEKAAVAKLEKFLESHAVKSTWRLKGVQWRVQLKPRRNQEGPSIDIIAQLSLGAVARASASDPCAEVEEEIEYSCKGQNFSEPSADYSRLTASDVAPSVGYNDVEPDCGYLEAQPFF